MNGIHEVRGSIPLGSTNNEPSRSTNRLWTDWLIGFLLFSATAAVVVWQNLRLGVLWDLSYILENSYRISLGNIPYRDFPFPYPPLTFLIQAAIIKVSGAVFWHSIVYCALMSGLTTVLTWRIVSDLFSEFTRSRLLAIMLALPLVWLGIYCIYPHPFYDPDCTFAVLIGIYLLQKLASKHVASGRALLSGSVLIVPLFTKQNTGLAFLTAAITAVAGLAVVEIWRRRPFRKYVAALAGCLIAFGMVSLLIHFTAGLRNYWHWTIQFAASRRTPARSEMLGIYQGKILWLWIGLLLLGALLYRLNRKSSRVLALAAGLLLALPFVWPAIYLLRDQDSSERAERLMALWPVLLIFSLLVTIVTAKRRRGFSLALPFILVVTINGAFMSQQLWGSTYAIWPLFIILLANTLASVQALRAESLDQRESVAAPAADPIRRLRVTRSRVLDLWTFLPFITLTVVSLLLAGGFYVWSHERLDYANLDDGALTKSSLPALQGLSVRGDWLPNFEEMVFYADRNIPRDEGILMLPGEDLFYYATGRRPQFPVLLFDHTVNPYSPEEILNLARQRNILWLIVKQDLQDEDEHLEKQRDEITDVLEHDFEQVETLKNYDIYHRKDPSKSDESNDDNDDDSGSP